VAEAPGRLTVWLRLDRPIDRRFDGELRATAVIDGQIASLRPVAGRIGAWRVEERIPLPPPEQSDGDRADALAQVAFLRRPAELPYDEWLGHWHGPHTTIAMETQATFGYVQNRVVAALTDDAPAVDAVVADVVPPLPPQAASTSAATSASNSVRTQSRRWPFGLPIPLNIYFHPFPDIRGRKMMPPSSSLTRLQDVGRYHFPPHVH